MASTAWRKTYKKKTNQKKLKRANKTLKNLNKINKKKHGGSDLQNESYDFSKIHPASIFI